MAREERIDEATVDVELAWEACAEAERGVVSAEVMAATAVERLLGERLSITDVVKLTRFDHPNLRRLRQAKATLEEPPKALDLSRSSALGGLPWLGV